jgi:hypothetical protein
LQNNKKLVIFFPYVESLTFYTCKSTQDNNIGLCSK